MIALIAQVAAAQTSTFDGIAEGTNGPLIADGGLVFTNLDNRGLSPIPGNIAIEQADADLTGLAGFTPTMALGFGGYSAGPGASFGRFGAIEISNGGLGDSAELFVFEGGFQGGLTLTLEALSGGVVVASDSEPLNAAFGVVSHTLSVSGATFDLLRLSVGPLPTDAAFILIDTVTISYGAVGTTGDTGGTVVVPTGDTGGIVVVPGDTGLPASTAETGAPPDDSDTGGAPTDTADTADTATEPDTDLPDTDLPATTPTDDPAPPDDTGAVDDEKGGCGCASGAPLGGWMALLPLLVLRRRR